MNCRSRYTIKEFFTPLILSCILFVIGMFLPTKSSYVFADSSWNVVSSPAPGSGSVLNAITSISSNDVWAVGTYLTPNAYPLAVHWNGSSWGNNAISNATNFLGVGLNGVSAISSSNVLAVGALPSGTFAMHYDGNSWSQIASDSPGTYPYLAAVGSDSGGDAWAVGTTDVNGVTHPLMERYHDSAIGFQNWLPSGATVFPNISGSTADVLTSVAVYSSTDAWAVGYYRDTSNNVYPLTYHWDGTSWINIVAPSPSGGSYTKLFGVTAISANDVWAVGASNGTTYTIHWDGSLWNIISSPSPSQTNDDALYAVSAKSTNEVYAVGYTRGPITAQARHPLILKYNGSTWQQQAAPDPSSGDISNLFGISVTSDNASIEAWTVGSFALGTLTLHYAPNSTILNVPLFKQGIFPFDNNNPIWEGEEFDHANGGQFTCGKLMWECGCSTTSIAMVLKSYGINKLPNGQDLNPGTLNTWLKNNDGYNRNLGVIWDVAATLASKAKSQNPNFMYDGLEYNRVAGMDKAQLTDDINNNIPDILEEPNHYIVAKGIDGDTFSIHDPFFDKTSLTSYDNSFLSLRRYVPSHTDMSYITFVVDNDVDISVKNSTGSVVGESYLEYPIVNPQEQTGALVTDNALKIFQYPKPSTGTYTVELNSPTAKNYQLDEYVITQYGDVKKESVTGSLATNINADLSLSYDKQSTDGTTIKPNITLNVLKADLQKLYNQGLIDNKGIFASLKAEVELAIQASKVKPQSFGNKLTIAALKVFVAEINAQRGKHVKEDAYQILKNEADYLIKNTY